MITIYFNTQLHLKHMIFRLNLENKRSENNPYEN